MVRVRESPGKSTKGASVNRRILWDHGSLTPYVMDSWEALEPSVLRPGGIITAAFIAAGAQDFRAAAAYVNRLAYGRNAIPADALCVIREGCGTCSTKHALLRRLALEQGLDIVLFLGLYEMTERNTPGVGKVLAANGFDSLLEAHCYLRSGLRRIDVTRVTGQALLAPIASFLHEEEIAPEQIGEYKTSLHRKFLWQWAERENLRKQHTLEDLWRIREQCIAALSGLEGQELSPE